MPKSNLLSILKKANALAHISIKNNISTSELLEKQQAFQESRRNFIEKSAKAGLLLSSIPLIGSFPSCVTAKDIKVAVVGAGIAGLNAAYKLKNSGVEAKVFEATKRAGGRMMSIKGYVSENITTEVGAEFIDTNHLEMLSLVKEFNLSMIDVTQDTLEIKDSFFIEGTSYTLQEVVEAFKEIIPQLEKDKNSIDEDYSNEATVELDNMDLRSYLENLEGKTWFSKMLDYAYQGEFGVDSNQQSSLNLIDFISTDTKDNEFLIFGESDERFKVVGGNERVTEELYNRVKDQVEFDRALTSITKEGDKYKLEFKGGGSYVADFVIVTIPFSVLRNVNLDVPELSEEKKNCINNLGYGSNTKVMMGFEDRPWRKLGKQGYLFNDVVHNGWDHGHMQNDNLGPTGYTVFLGGKVGLGAEKTFTQSLKDTYLTQLDTVFSGSKDAYTQILQSSRWNGNPFAQGSYSAYKVGQWTTISGLEIEPVGNIYFAGEHCSDAFQGYMNGGAETGKVVAEQVLAKIKS